MISIEVTITVDYDGLISHYHVADNYLDSIITVKLIITVRQWRGSRTQNHLKKERITEKQLQQEEADEKINKFNVRL